MAHSLPSGYRRGARTRRRPGAFALLPKRSQKNLRGNLAFTPFCSMGEGRSATTQIGRQLTVMTPPLALFHSWPLWDQAHHFDLGCTLDGVAADVAAPVEQRNLRHSACRALGVRPRGQFPHLVRRGLRHFRTAARRCGHQGPGGRALLRAIASGDGAAAGTRDQASARVHDRRRPAVRLRQGPAHAAHWRSDLHGRPGGPPPRAEAQPLELPTQSLDPVAGDASLCRSAG